MENEKLYKFLKKFAHRREPSTPKDLEQFELLWKTAAMFNIHPGNRGNGSRGSSVETKSLRAFLSQMRYSENQYRLRRGQTQAISYMCNRIEQNIPSCLYSYLKLQRPNLVWRVSAGGFRGAVIGSVIARTEFSAKKIAEMMYSMFLKPDTHWHVDWKEPVFEDTDFIFYQQLAIDNLKKKINRCNVQIDSANKEKEIYNAMIETAFLNLTAFIPTEEINDKK